MTTRQRVTRLTPECFGRLCMLPALKDWERAPRRGSRGKPKLRKWLEVEDEDGATCVVDYNTLRALLVSLRRKPVEVRSDRRYLHVSYPRGSVRLHLHNPIEAWQLMAGPSATVENVAAVG